MLNNVKHNWISYINWMIKDIYNFKYDSSLSINRIIISSFNFHDSWSSRNQFLSFNRCYNHSRHPCIGSYKFLVGSLIQWLIVHELHWYCLDDHIDTDITLRRRKSRLFTSWTPSKHQRNIVKSNFCFRFFNGKSGVMIRFGVSFSKSCKTKL